MNKGIKEPLYYNYIHKLKYKSKNREAERYSSLDSDISQVKEPISVESFHFQSNLMII